MTTTMEDASILIVDDEVSNVRLLERMLRQAGYANVVATTDARDVPMLFLEQRPDLILLDLHMPHVDGFETLERLSTMIADGAYLPILVLTADITTTARVRALTNGARDFVTKPFDVTEVLLRIRNLLQTRSLHVGLTGRLDETMMEADEAHLETLNRLARAAEYRDDETGDHIARVGAMAGKLALAMGLPHEETEMIRVAAPLHDVGKIGVADSVLLKPGPLTAEEFEGIRAHSIIGAGILSGSRAPVVALASQIALTHHERWDGEGYPQGLRGTQIPIAGRIVAITDVYDALTHARRYKDAWSPERALEEIAKQSARQFDPDIVTTFLRIAHDIDL